MHTVSVIAICACLLYIGWAMLRAVDESIARSRRTHAETLLILAADSVAANWANAVKAGRTTGQLKPDEVNKAHIAIMGSACCRAREDRFDIVGACGGNNGLEAMAWIQARRIAR